MNTNSSWVRVKTAAVLLLFMIFSISPIPITSSIGLFVVLFRPIWFKRLVEKIYADKEE